MRKLMKIAASAAVLASAVTLIAGPALADPVNGSGSPVTPKETDVVSVGSDTSEYLVDQLAFDYNKSHSTGPRLYSWDAVNPVTGLTDNIKTKFGCTAIVRPNGATAGLTAFYANAKTSDGKHYCIDYVRSARGRSSTDPAKGPGGVTFVALAKDAISYAANATTNAPHNLTTAQLNAIYTCTATAWNQVGGTSTDTIQAFLPQTGSGLRTSFLKAIGVATPGSCVNSSVQQNEGTDPQFKGNADALVPYSVAKYISQRYHSAKCGVKPTATQNRFGCDEHGAFILNSVNGTKPTTGTGTGTTINPLFSAKFINAIYDVVRWAQTRDNIPAYLEPFFASAFATTRGWICSNTTARQDLINYGFLPTPFCGTGS
ncbi:MAG TPA: substrate-binding domain-containing protein [Streptosporangiaceae bacterium]